MTVGRFKLKTPPRFVVLEDKFLPMALNGIVPLQNGVGPAYAEYGYGWQRRLISI